MGVSNPEQFVQDDSAQTAATNGMANIFGMSSDHVSANMQVKTRRIIRRRMQDTTGAAIINYKMTYSSSTIDGNYSPITGDSIVETLTQDGFTSTLTENINAEMPTEVAETYGMNVLGVAEPTMTEEEVPVTGNSFSCIID